MYTYENSLWKGLNQLVLPLCAGASNNNFVSFRGAFHEVTTDNTFDKS